METGSLIVVSSLPGFSWRWGFLAARAGCDPTGFTVFAPHQVGVGQSDRRIDPLPTGRGTRKAIGCGSVVFQRKWHIG